MYVTPFFIWTNYDIEEKEIGAISSNYLALEILKAANIPYSGYYSLLEKIYNEYPVISKNGIINKDGLWMNTADVQDDETLLLEQQLQYYRIYE